MPGYIDFSSTSWPESIGLWFTLNSLLAAGALLLDRLFGEFLNRWHPVVLIGAWINGFNRYFYADSIQRGGLLLLSTLAITLLVSMVICTLLNFLPFWLSVPLAMIAASTLLAHRMLYDSVSAVLHSEHPASAVAVLVSRDTEQLSDADAYKAAMESYAENLSDGVVAPLLFLLLFGLPGIALYKAINTLDSMVGYRTERFENYGKISAKVDDIANWLPARLSAILLMLVFKQWRFWAFYSYGRAHASPNAGHPIAAMALACHCRLGGATRYFGRWQDKAYFGRAEETQHIQAHHLACSLSQRDLIDCLLITGCVLPTLWLF
ncbi:hypothetical protein THMIRHAS_14750 [Thiosulfatimonas sediminis]|uniref:Cobalamin biosynthesis protein CobD n=1 Tax=Thiosulfatimonas sediminis TaxID=2675054 RepID=A0A6F8PVC8_9GAMM|nr:adenosylcobinamide-phosphate synthase CbiB [Thiosulfatimonas sediminis]BBP46102.1 hypothetical protein THMIRHAS_14750 [Thiosulfatimonas sediminis]